MFLPRSVAVIGATDSPGTVGRSVVSNLLESKFPLKIYPVNPSHPEVAGLKTQQRIADIPGGVDLALVVTPAQTVPQIIGECVDAGVKSAVVISAGFREQGPDGARLEDEIKKHLQRGSLRLIGPNCMGFMNPTIGLNATFAKTIPKKGSVAFLSQSGALQTAILDWSRKEDVGFSAIVSTGSMLDVGWGDLIYYFGDDPHTKSILIYMESVGDARSFLAAAREIALGKPIIVIKAGRSEAASRAAASHTGALTGSDDVLEAAFRRCGVLRVQNLADLFYMAETLSKQPRPRGPRLSIVTNAGGPGVLATDALMATGGELTVLSQTTLQELDGFLSPHWSRHNPVDVLADADAERFVKAVDTVSKDPAGDALLVNSRYEELFGIRREQIYGKSDHDIFPRPMADEIRAADLRVLADRQPRQEEEIIPQPEGLRTYLSVKFPLYDEQGIPTGLCGIATDVTELKNAQDQLRRLSGSIMANQENERRAIARELHDELGQVLTALRMDAVWLCERLKLTDAKAGDRALAMCRLIDQTIDEVRGLATRLRPGVLDDLGLLDALEWYITDFEKRTGIACIFKHGEVPDVDGIGATAAYRIAQEALTNVTRHAAATQVQVSLRADRGILTLAVVDNGRGFDPKEIAAAECLGLAGMRERAGLLGGSLEIRSRLGKGTKVCFKLPVEGNQELVP